MSTKCTKRALAARAKSRKRHDEQGEVRWSLARREDQYASLGDLGGRGLLACLTVARLVRFFSPRPSPVSLLLADLGGWDGPNK